MVFQLNAISCKLEFVIWNNYYLIYFFSVNFLVSCVVWYCGLVKSLKCFLKMYFIYVQQFEDLVDVDKKIKMKCLGYMISSHLIYLK